MKLNLIALGTVACVISTLNIGAARADDCSGRDHTAGTVLGAVGGAAIGGAASNNAGGAIAGAVVGGLAGNAIARSQDCNRQYDRRGGYVGGTAYYQPTYVSPNVTPDEDDYWAVESYDDFNNDYRHIFSQIRRGREEGSLTRSDAGRYLDRLQRIRQRADWQQRSGRFDPEDIEAQLRDLRRNIHYARREGQDQYYQR